MILHKEKHTHQAKQNSTQVHMVLRPVSSLRGIPGVKRGIEDPVLTPESPVEDI